MNWRRITGTALAALTIGVTLTSCGLANTDGQILETETGRNGVKAEIKDGDGDFEVYLIPNTECREGDYLKDCADDDDYLVRSPGAQPGLNHDDGGDRDGD